MRASVVRSDAAILHECRAFAEFPCPTTGGLDSGLLPNSGLQLMRQGGAKAHVMTDLLANPRMMPTYLVGPFVVDRNAGWQDASHKAPRQMSHRKRCHERRHPAGNL